MAVQREPFLVSNYGFSLVPRGVRLVLGLPAMNHGSVGGKDVMNISVSGKQIDLGDAFRTHAEDALGSVLKKYFGHAVHANVVISHQGSLYRADISVVVGRGLDFQGRGEASEIPPAFEIALEKTTKQLRREKRRLNDHHRNEHQREASGG